MFRTPTDLSSKLRFACGTPEFLNVVEPIVVIFIKISSDILPRKFYFCIPLVFWGGITNPSNTVAVATLIEEIKLDLKDQTGSWRKVSERLN